MDYKDTIEAKLSEIEGILNAYPRGAMGLTMDSAKDAAWRKAKQDFSYWFRELQKYNKQFLKTHKRVGFEVVNGKRVIIYQPK